MSGGVPINIPSAAIDNMLTRDDKANVLIAAGIATGRAACIADKGPADF